MNKQDLNWLRSEIIDGLTRMALLSLDRTPAMDLIEGTVGVWVDALSSSRNWDRERDVPRINAAFRCLESTVNIWPSPAKFLEVMPPIPNPHFVALSREPDMETRAISEKTRKIIDTLAKKMRMNMSMGRDA